MNKPIPAGYAETVDEAARVDEHNAQFADTSSFIEKIAQQAGALITLKDGNYGNVQAGAVIFTPQEWQSFCGALSSPAPVAAPAPIDMVLHCPKCGLQHVDAPDERTPDWKNEPHRSHLCHGCGHIWRPADVPTNGVQAVKTTGKADSPIAAPAPASEAAKLDYVTRSLRAIADRGRAELGDSYPEIVSLWATVRDLHRGDSADAPVQQAGRLGALLQDIDYAVHHGWPTESLERIKRKAAALKGVSALLSESEQRAILADPCGLASLINYYDCQMAADHGEEWEDMKARNDKMLARQHELLTLGRMIILRDPESFIAEIREQFNPRSSEGEGSPE